MRPFRIALSGDYLNEAGESAYGDLGWSSWDSQPCIRYRFLTEQAPRPDDRGYWDRFYSLEITPEQIADIDGLVVVRPWVQRAAFRDGAANLVVIGRSGAGYDKIDLDACTENDVALFNAPLALNHSTASSALLFILALAKRLPQQERITRQGRWDLQRAVLGGELPGRTLGIVGLGHSGRELVRLVAPFEMRVLAYSPHADATEASRLGVRLTTLEETLREADFVSLHCRLTGATRRMIGSREFALMKRGVYFVNVARGELVDEDALVKALRSGHVAGAGLDVFEHEPLPRDHPLLELDNVIVTPHWSASTTDVWRATSRAMIEGMMRASQGLVPENVVNTAVLERPGFRAKLVRFAENRP
ncbi:MAG TPA: NAD(P)-dependent oxidoreductase [Gemmataceae bacterium]|jgi:phosphoglycerate dehydrogenase-like enzyme